MKTLGWSLLLLVAITSGAFADPQRRARQDIDAYYRSHVRQPPLEQAGRDLQSPDAAIRHNAGAYLVDMLRLLQQDAASGQSPITSSPFFGVGATQDARELKASVAGFIAYRAQGQDALEAITWLLREDPAADDEQCGMRALKRVPGPEAARLVISLLDPPHPNQAVLVGALNTVRDRRLSDAGAQVRTLAGHYRTRVRKAAAEAAVALGLPTAPAWNNSGPMPVPLASQLKLIGDMLPVSVPPGTPWVHIRYRTGSYTNDGPIMAECSAWLLSHAGGHLHVLDIFGVEDDIDETGVRVQARTLAEDAVRLLKVRARYVPLVQDSWMKDLSHDGIVVGTKSGVSEPEFISAPEALVALWLSQAGQDRLARQLLLPRMDALPDDRWLTWTLRDVIGAEQHQAMLEAFAEQADYPRATRIAHHLVSAAFDGYPYQARARELEQQLARRGDDFHSLTLPTPHAWALARKTMSRPQQVAYLLARLRLLRCRQWGQPGALSPSDQQIAPGMVLLINPLAELSDMHLSRRELALLVPGLADEDFILGYSYFRDFLPQRELHRVNQMVSLVFNEAAGRERVKLEDYYRCDAAGRQAWLTALKGWCHS